MNVFRKSRNFNAEVAISTQPLRICRNLGDFLDSYKVWNVQFETVLSGSISSQRSGWIPQAREVDTVRSPRGWPVQTSLCQGVALLPSANLVVKVAGGPASV